MYIKTIIRTILSCLLLAFATTHVYSQTDSLNFGPEPIGGINKLVLEYYRIDFTKAQRAVLQQQEVEFIFSIDEAGVAVLEEINGVTDKAIVDSLRLASKRLPGFHPRTVQGTKESALYFLKLQFPKYRVAEPRAGYQEATNYNEARYEDFEYIRKSGERIDILFGGVGNAFLGSPGQYLGPGGGMKTEVLYVGKNGFGGGMVMSFYGNKLKQMYPIASNREQNSAPPTLLIGIGLNKILVQKERREANIQLDLTAAVQNITPRLGNADHEWTQLRGFSPGIVGNYLIQFGKNKSYYYYGRPSVSSHYLNIHGALRPVFFNLKEASGVMLEAGLSYRLGIHHVEEYRLKP